MTHVPGPTRLYVVNNLFVLIQRVSRSYTISPSLCLLSDSSFDHSPLGDHVEPLLREAAVCEGQAGRNWIDKRRTIMTPRDVKRRFTDDSARIGARGAFLLLVSTEIYRSDDRAYWSRTETLSGKGPTYYYMFIISLGSG